MQCPRCQQENLTSHKCCRECGTPLGRLEGGAQPALSYAEMQRSLAEALEQQTATAEILHVISSSTTDLQPVLMTVAQNAARVCGAIDAQIYRVEGDFLHWVASHGPIPPNTEERLISRGWVTGRAVVDRRTIHVHDLAAESDTEYPVGKAAQRQTGHRTTLATPLLREGVPLGVISIRRMEVRPFSETQVTLLETFADQAVIAIENVRLFTELQEKNRALTQAHAQVTEALEQQTATSEILRVISSSPTAVQPTFDAIAASATRLCAALNSLVIRFDGQLMHLAAYHNVSPERFDALQRVFPLPPSRASMSGRAILTCAVAQTRDISTDPEYALPTQTLVGYRSVLAVPMLREGVPIGAILVARDHVAPFSDSQIELLQTFADQAVIAIENVRLFKELEVRNTELTEALEQQVATSEILRVISSSPTDAQPVFETIVRSAARLCHAPVAGVFLTEGRMVHHLANYGASPEALAVTRSWYPRPVEMDSTPGMAILTRSVVQVPDIEDPSAGEVVRQIGRGLGFRSSVGVPMLREGVAVGSIIVNRREPGTFSDAALELLKTFADQAVIAIENVRLFRELQTRNGELTEALDQ